jgi:hypothetical protein
VKLLNWAAPAAAVLLVLAGCSSATGNSKNNGPDPVNTVTASLTTPSDWAGGGSTSTATLAAGYQNTATGFALTTASQGAQAYRAMNFATDGSGTTAWVDGTGATPLFPAATELKGTVAVSIPDPTTNGDAHVVLDVKNLDLSQLGSHTGITFAVQLPDFGGNTGLGVLVRQSSPTNPNVAVYEALLGGDDDGAGTISKTDGSSADWVYWGNHNLFVFKVPFDFFTVPGWLGGASSEPGAATSISAALTAGAAFNSIGLDFRFNNAGSAYSATTPYTIYVSPVAYY